MSLKNTVFTSVLASSVICLSVLYWGIPMMYNKHFEAKPSLRYQNSSDSIFSLDVPMTGDKGVIGILNSESCIMGSKHGQRGTSLLESENARMREEVKELDDRILSMQEQLQDEQFKTTTTEEARTELHKEWLTLRRARDEKAANNSNRVYRLQMELVQKLSEMISEASKVVCEKMGLKLLISSSAAQYHHEALNFTNEVIAELNLLPDFELSYSSLEENTDKD